MSKKVILYLLFSVILSVNVFAADVIDSMIVTKANLEKEKSIAKLDDNTNKTQDSLVQMEARHKDSQWQDYDVEYFGEHLFNGHFLNKEISSESQEYIVSIGDIIEINLWGAFMFSDKVTVNVQGDVFIPNVGNVAVLGVKNKDLDQHIKKIISKVFKKNVNVYSNILKYNKIRVFVTGFVRNPGVYDGNSFSSELPYLDQAGGIDMKKGSFVDIRVIRNEKVVHNLNLYNFLIDGKLDFFQLKNGDIINVGKKKGIVSVVGDVINRGKFEINENTYGSDVISYVNPMPTVSSVSLTTANDKQINNIYYTLEEFKKIKISPDDKITFISTLKNNTIRVIVKGEHLGENVIIINYDQTLDVILKQLKFSNLSDKDSIFLYRKSAAKIQKEWLNRTLDEFERALLNYSPISVDDALVRDKEIKTLKEFITNARKAPGNGMVTLYDQDGILIDPTKSYLEDEDILFIPRKTNFIGIFGQVHTPSFLTYKEGESARYYINAAGGILNGSSMDGLFVKHANGTINKISRFASIKPGDEIYIMPEVGFKTVQFAKDIIDVTFKTALMGRFLLI